MVGTRNSKQAVPGTTKPDRQTLGAERPATDKAGGSLWRTCLSAAAVTAALVSAGLAGTAPPPVSAATVDQPNILIVNLDDLRTPGTLGVMPEVSAFFADGGRTYPNSFASTPLCSPSRASLFTGRYGHNNAVTGNGLVAETAALDQAATFQGYLNANGYNTALAGKYMNDVPLSNPPQQWDRWLFTGGGYRDVSFNDDGKISTLPGYYSDVVGDHVVEYLQDFESTDDTPWLIYVAPQAPHSPSTPSVEYSNAPVPAFNPPPNYNEPDISDKPATVSWRPPLDNARVESLRTAHLRTLMSVDDLVGRVVDEMDRLGETGRTLAIFTSDNGYLWGEHRILDKRYPYTASVTVPLLVRWPGRIPAGGTDDRLVTNVDMLPTLLEAAAVSPTLKYPLDGTSFLSGPPRTQLLVEYGRTLDAPISQWASIRTPTQQYVEWFDSAGAVKGREYYNLTADPWQLVNIYGDGITGNDPPVTTWTQQLKSLRTCVGAACVVTGTPVPQQPVAVIATPVCNGLACSFDGSGSKDPDGGTLQSFAWDFGDGSSGTGTSPQHTYASAGTYSLSLTVVDDENAAGSAGRDVTVAQAGQIAFRAAVGRSAVSARASVTVPSSVQASDGMLLFASSASATATLTAPTGWSQVSRQVDGLMQTVLWQRVAPQGTAGSTVSVTSSTSVKLNVTLLAYAQTSASEPVAQAVSAAEAVTRTGHTTPVVSAQPGEWVVSYWADCTGSATGWTRPDGVKVRMRLLQTGTNRITSIAADGGAPSDGGSEGGLTATSVSSGTATMWTVRLAP